MCQLAKCEGAKLCLGTKCDGAKMCLVVLGTKLRWGQIVSGDKMFGPKGVRPKLAGPNCEAAQDQSHTVSSSTYCNCYLESCFPVSRHHFDPLNIFPCPLWTITLRMFTTLSFHIVGTCRFNIFLNPTARGNIALA